MPPEGLPPEPPPDEPDEPPIFELHPEPETKKARFCKRCGNRLDVLGLCPACAQPAPQRMHTQHASDSSLGSALGLYFALLASFIFIVFNDSVGWILFVDALDAVLVFIWAAIWWRPLRPVLGPPDPPAWYGFAALLSVATVAFSLSFVGLLGSAFGVESEQYAQPYLDEGYGWHWIVLSIVIQPALIEELAFRGVIVEALRRVLSVRETIIVSAVLFTILHLSVLSFPHLMLMGVLLAWMRFKCGSIWPGVILHGCHNGLVLIAERQGWG